MKIFKIFGMSVFALLAWGACSDDNDSKNKSDLPVFNVISHNFKGFHLSYTRHNKRRHCHRELCRRIFYGKIAKHRYF